MVLAGQNQSWLIDGTLEFETKGVEGALYFFFRAVTEELEDGLGR